MNQDRIRYTTRNTNPKPQPQFFFRRSEIAFDERVRYVESVCQVLIESRFGPGRVAPVVINLSDRPEFEEAVFYDVIGDEVVPSYSLSPVGRNGYQVFEAAYRKAKQMELLNAGPKAHNSTSVLTPNHGRGSP